MSKCGNIMAIAIISSIMMIYSILFTQLYRYIHTHIHKMDK